MISVLLLIHSVDQCKWREKKLMMHRPAIRRKMDEKKKKKNEEYRRDKTKKYDSGHRWMYAALSSASTLLNERERENVRRRKRKNVNERNDSIFNSFEILNTNKVYVCVMLSIAHPVIDGDGTSSLIHFSPGTLLSDICHLRRVFYCTKKTTASHRYLVRLVDNSRRDRFEQF